MDRETQFVIFLSGLRGMSLHPGAGQRGHAARTLDQDVDEAKAMLEATAKLKAEGFLRDTE